MYSFQSLHPKLESGENNQTGHSGVKIQNNLNEKLTLTNEIYREKVKNYAWIQKNEMLAQMVTNHYIYKEQLKISVE